MYNNILPVLFILAAVAAASQWTVTSYYVITTTTSIYSTYTTHEWAQDTYTSTFSLKSGVTPTVSTYLSRSTSTDNVYDLEIVEVYLDPTAVKKDDLQFTRPSYTPKTVYTRYQQPVVITGPASCATAFTDTTFVSVRIPTEAEDQVTPASYETQYFTYDSGSTVTYITAYLYEAVSVDPKYYSQLLEDYASRCRDFRFRSYNDDKDFGGSSSGGSGNRGYGNENDDDDDHDGFLGDAGDLGVCSLVTGCTSLRTWVIVVIALVCSCFVLGFFESFFWFRRLMQGRTALRLGTVCWILITWLTLCLTRTAKARSKEDQQRLREQWKSIRFGRRLVLWLKWGFRWTYPVELLGEPTSSQAATAVEVVNEAAPPAYTTYNKTATKEVVH